MSAAPQPEITEILKDLGLAKKEIGIYLALLEVGASTAGALAKRSNNSRSTVYSALDILANRGLAIVDIRGEAKYFIAEPPSKIINYLDTEIEKTEQKKKIVQAALPSLQKLYQSLNTALPKIRFFMGAQSVERFLYDNQRKWWRECIESDGIWWGYQDARFVVRWKDWLEETWAYNTTLPKPASIKIISNETHLEKSLKKRRQEIRREIRFLPKNINDFTSTLWVCGHYIILLYHQNNVDYAVEIYDPVFAKNERALIKMIYEHQARP